MKLFFFGKSKTNKKVTTNVIWYFRKLRVRVVNDYATHQWHYLKTLKASHRFYRSNQAKKDIGCVNRSNSNNLKIWKPPYLKKNLCVRVVVDYADTGFSIFAIEYLRENENVCKTVFACSYGAKVESFKPKNSQKYRDTVPLIDHHTS